MLARAVVTLNNGILGGTGTNTWHIRTAEAPLPAMNQLMEYVRTFYETVDADYAQGTAIKFDGEVIGVGPDEGESMQGDVWQVDGTGNPKALPPSQCVVIGWRTNSGGRQGRGRTFCGPLCEATCENDGTPTPASLQAFREAADALVASSQEALDGALGVWSREGQVFRDFTSAVVHDQYGSLRSRRD